MFNPQTVSRLTHLWCGVVVLTSVGCQTYSPYGYGSYGSYPGTYGTPVYTQPGQPVYGSPGMAPVPNVPPGGAYPPPGGYPPGGGMQSAPAYSPGTVTPATPFPNVPNGPQSGDASGGLGQPGAFPNGSTQAPVPHVPVGTNKAVPNYPDPDSFSPGKSPAAPLSIDDAADEAQRALDRLKTMENDPTKKAGASLTAPHADEIQFTPPVSGRGGRNSQSGIIQTAHHGESISGSNQLRPYGRAQDGQAWFRGLIDFDEDAKQWYLIYNPEPGIDDRQGGMITLVDRPEFSLLPRDNPVTLEGGFDAAQLDADGRPKYRVNIVRPLIP